MRKYFFLFAIGLLLISFQVQAAEIGESAPKLIVNELDGKEFDLSAMRGKIVVINFWATWCETCQQEMPILESIYRKYHARGLEMLGLSINNSHERDEINRSMAKFSYPAAILSEAQENGFGTTHVMPITYIIDKSGIIRAKFGIDSKPASEESLIQAIKPLL